MDQELQTLVFVGGLSRLLNPTDIVRLRGANFAALRLNERAVSEEEREMACLLPSPLAMFGRDTLDGMLFFCGTENEQDHAVICECSGKPLRPYTRIPNSEEPLSQGTRASFLVPKSAATVYSLKPATDISEFLVGIDRRWITFGESGEVIVVSKRWFGFISDLPECLGGFADPIRALWQKVSAPFADIFYAEDGVRDRLPRSLERLISQKA